MKIHVAIVSKVLLLVIAGLNTTPMVSASDITCGTIAGNRIHVGNDGNTMDEQVMGCPWGYHWESCCTVCGYNLQHDGKLGPGWYCEKNLANGVWLKGCRHENACPSDLAMDVEEESSA